MVNRASNEEGIAPLLVLPSGLEAARCRAPFTPHMGAEQQSE